MVNKRIIFGILTNYVQFVINILLGVFLSPIVLKYAGKETMGAYAILLQIISYIGLLDLGVNFSTSRFLAKAYIKGNTEFFNVVNIYRSVSILQNLLMAILFIWLSFYLNDIFHFPKTILSEMKISLWILALWNIFSSPWLFYSGVLNTTNHLAEQNIIDSITNFLRIILAITFVMLGLSILGLVLSQVISSLFGLILKSYYTNKRVGKFRFVFSLTLDSQFKEILIFSLNGFFISLASRLIFSSDNLIVGYLFGTIAVTSYYLTFQPGSMLSQLLQKVTDNFKPTINIHFANKDYEKLRSTFLTLFRVNFLLGVLMLWSITFFTETLIKIWVGESNYLIQPMALWCGLFSFLMLLNNIAMPFVLANGVIKTLSIFAISEGIINILFSFVLGKILGPHGIMLSSFLANIPSFIYLFLTVTKLLNVANEFKREFLNLKYLFIFSFIPIIWFVLKMILLKTNLAIFQNNFLLSIILLFTIFPITILFMYNLILKENEQKIVKKIMRLKKF